MTAVGNAGDDLITGGAGDDIMIGGDDADTFLVGDGFGTDTIFGGNGGNNQDTLDLSALTNPVTVIFTGPGAGTVTDQITGDVITFSEIETLILPNQTDTVNAAADSGATEIVGLDGADALSGGAAGDTLAGGLGDDQITFSEGDTATGGSGDDTFIASDLGETSNGTVTIDGGGDGETAGGGDTLQLGTLADLSTLNISSTTTNASGNTSLAGSVQMDDGTLLNFSGIESVICFTPGTRIATPSGPRLIEALRTGDPVITRDSGIQRLNWVGKRRVPARGRFAPVRIRSGVLHGQDGDLLVSPQHRLLFTGYQSELLFGHSEVLVSALHLVDGMDVTQDEGDEVTYIHLLFDQHEIIFAEGAATESFHPGGVGLTALDDYEREELFTLFPELRTDVARYGETARRCLKKHEAAALRA